MTQSQLEDPRRPGDMAPLGRDPDFVSFNFEVMATLEEGSDPALCEEGQRVKRTSRLGSNPVEQKKACTAGRDLATCRVNTDCDTHTCRGGDYAGRPCDDFDSNRLCRLGGGICLSNLDGRCTEFPFAGPNRGNDDYKSPLEPVKRHCPTCESPTWLDAPGLSGSLHAEIPEDFRYEADFLMFLRGRGMGSTCSCHVRLLIDWDGMNQMFRAGTGLTLVQDAESVNCSLQ